MKKQILLSAVGVSLISLGMAGAADAALIGRLAATPGGTDYQAYYDDVANLTWLADAYYAATSGYDADGRMTWQAANIWAAQLTVGGAGGWRLPITLQSDPSCDYRGGNESSGGYDCTGSELGNLFYTALGNSADSLTNPGPFSNIQSSYWSVTEFTSETNDAAWGFNMSAGSQRPSNKSSSFFSWAVQSGDVSAVPVPAAVWLFGSGLVGLIGFARRRGA